jgi:Berberine and berberine like
MAYSALQSMFDALNPQGCNGTGKAISSHRCRTRPSRRTSHTPPRRRATSRVCTRYPIDGAVQKAKCGTAWSARDAAYSMVAGIDPDPLKAGQLKEWATPYWKGVHPYDLAGAYTNFMMGGDGEERIKVSFGDNYPRLKALNAKYDPTNLSRVNQSVRPAD